ncbi:hypothetical protein FDP41_002715 [Naegleria fowleri]|uniref:Uncharacterized protein n=1 Tax=Naegleria fowleri TaxID=5763 RepID=A0A6A5BX31_NAEFO|nr:uncharacterized protein FDP41_002715 [Naegleria fowleri]KAF0978200.1 hypothetical protein FDP41_002715 [Naegleria fowleri]CAG4711414.1 unnamed protein product [Naegleria fowleri]
MLILNSGGTRRVYSTSCCDKCLRDFSQVVSSTHQCHNCQRKFCSVHANYHSKYFPYHHLTVSIENDDTSSSDSSSSFDQEESVESSSEDSTPPCGHSRNENSRNDNEELLLGCPIKEISIVPRGVGQLTSTWSSPSKSLLKQHQHERIHSQFEDLKDDLKRLEQVHFRGFCNLTDEFQDIEKHRLDLKMESQRIFSSLRKTLYEREDEVSLNIDKICNEQKEMVMKISSLKNHLRMVMTEIESMKCEESNFEKMERKLQHLNATIDSLKLQCQYQSVNGIQNYRLRYLPILEEIEEDIRRLCHLQKLN